MSTCSPSAHQVPCRPADPSKFSSKRFITNELSSVALFHFALRDTKKAWDRAGAYCKPPGVPSGVRQPQQAFGCTFLSGMGQVEGSTGAAPPPAHWL